MDTKVGKWDRWLDVIYEDLKNQAACRLVYRETIAIVDSNPDIPPEPDFFDCLDRWYVDSTVMGLRRQAKPHRDAISIAGMLEDMADNATLLSREHIVSLYGDPERGNADFDRCAGVGANHVDPQALRDDLSRFRNLAASCEEYADRFIAHRDKRPPARIATYRELDEAIAFAEDILKKCFFLVRAVGLVSVTPVFQGNWKRVFTVPWLRRS